MSQTHAISIHFDADIFDGVIDADTLDLDASLRHLATATDTALRARYPDALVSVTWDSCTSGQNHCHVTDDEGADADPCDRDDVRDTCGRVWESWAWAVLVDGSAS